MLHAIFVTALIVASPAPQSADRTTAAVAPLMGNTIEVRYDKQVMMTSSFAADGTFKMKLSDGTRASGDWVADDRHLCWITKMPVAPAGKNVRCEAVVQGKKVGDTWTQTDTYGEEATVTLLAGDRL